MHPSLLRQLSEQTTAFKALFSLVRTILDLARFAHSANLSHQAWKSTLVQLNPMKTLGRPKHICSIPEIFTQQSSFLWLAAPKHGAYKFLLFHPFHAPAFPTQFSFACFWFFCRFSLSSSRSSVPFFAVSVITSFKLSIHALAAAMLVRCWRPPCSVFFTVLVLCLVLPTAHYLRSLTLMQYRSTQKAKVTCQALLMKDDH